MDNLNSKGCCLFRHACDYHMQKGVIFILITARGIFIYIPIHATTIFITNISTSDTIFVDVITTILYYYYYYYYQFFYDYD